MKPFPFTVLFGKLQSCPTSSLKLELDRNLLILEGGIHHHLTTIGKINEKQRLHFDSGSCEDIDGESIERLTDDDVIWARCCLVHIQGGMPRTVGVDVDLPKVDQATPVPEVSSEVLTHTQTQAEVRALFELMFNRTITLYPEISSIEELTCLVTRAMNERFG